MVQKRKYKPNSIPLKDRITTALLSIIIMSYGIYGIAKNDILIAIRLGRRYHRGPRLGNHFHNFSAWLIFLAMLCVAASMVAVIMDHYDKRDNEIKYKQFTRTTLIVGVALFVLAFVVGIYMGDVVPYNSLRK